MAAQNRKAHRLRAGLTPVLSAALVLCAVATGVSFGAPLDVPGPYSVWTEGFVGWINGRVGFDRRTGGVGTLNDLVEELGLPEQQISWRAGMSVRPLAHHRVRVYGTIPDRYIGHKALTRELRTRNGIFPVGTIVGSEMEWAQFGVGYDLDFLLAPTYTTGLSIDMKYHHARVRLLGPGLGLEDTITVDEAIPCLGAHTSTRFFKFTDGPFRWFGGIGLHADILFSMTPEYVNSFDMRAGLVAHFKFPWLPLMVTKAAYEHESLHMTHQASSGNVLQLKRNGVVFSLELVF